MPQLKHIRVQDLKGLFEVPFLPGDGTGAVMLQVRYISGSFPRDEKTCCAYCHGDPCNEDSPADSEISQFFARNKWAEVCPCCEGKSS